MSSGLIVEITTLNPGSYKTAEARMPINQQFVVPQFYNNNMLGEQQKVKSVFGARMTVSTCRDKAALVHWADSVNT
ncbi:hypothetical protein [uncultured Spirosoma sp.]|uniref:hypothetical protein n=1 Tax=uncultured Spirosoma sp. TaxID=278208 RepID=UPI00258382CF|nr:hypothetical protein [uncultured Spirosoma sp.]